jgi:hypothetical protein
VPSAKALAAVGCLLLFGCTTSLPRTSTKATEFTCGKTSRESFEARYRRNPEQFRQLVIGNRSKPFEPLDPGRYTLSVSGECYAATAHFMLNPQDINWPVDIDGDDLDLITHETNVIGLVVPVRPGTIKVHIERDGAVVLDQVVSDDTDCPTNELTEHPGDADPSDGASLCIFVRKDEVLDLCPNEPPRLDLRFRNDASGWQRGRAYELELIQDSARTRCEFEVPLPETDERPRELRCPIASSDIRQPSRLTLTGTPTTVVVRIRSGGALLFEGSAALRYADYRHECSNSEALELRPAKPDSP